MEKHIMANVCRQSLATIAISLFIALTTQAQVLTNAGFELGGGLYTNLDNGGAVSTGAVGWVQFNDAIRLWINDACSTEIAHSGSYALQCYGPSVLNDQGQPGGSYAQQMITTGVTNGQEWVLSGWGMTPSCDVMSDAPAGSTAFGCLIIQFYDATGTNTLGAGISSTHYCAPNHATPGGNDFVMSPDTWYNATVTAIAPSGAVQVAFQAMHVSDTTDTGSMYWDDLSVTNMGIPYVAPGVTNYFYETIQSGNQICWPTVAFASYQPQSSDDNVNWTNVGPLVPGDGNSNCVFGALHKFYRVQAYVTSGGANSFANPGFESGAASNADPNAASWVQFNDAFRTSTATSGTNLTAHGGTYSLKTYGPFGPGQDSSGAYQTAAASGSQHWRLTGYCLNWANDPLSGPNSQGGVESSYGVGQLLFMDTTGGTGNVLLAVDGPHYGTTTQFPLNQWQFFEVDGIAPGGTVNVRAQVSHVGYGANPGSVYWDDLTLYQPSSGSPTIGAVTAQPAVQVAWPTTAPTSNGIINAQIQTIGNIQLGVPFTPQTTSNLLLNGSFEPGINGTPNASSGDQPTSYTAAGTNVIHGPWFGWNNCYSPYSAFYTQHVTAQDGVQCAKTFCQVNAGIYQAVAVSPGEVLRGSAWFMDSSSDAMQGAETVDVRLIFHDAANGGGNTLATVVSPTVVSTASVQNVWHQLSVSAVAPAGTVSVVLMGFFNNPGNNGGAFFMDNASLTATSYGNWQNVGPLYPGNGTTNTLVDLVGTNATKFYRVITQ